MDFMSGAVIKVEQEKCRPFWKGYFLLTFYLNAFWIAGTLAASLSAQLVYVVIFELGRNLPAGSDQINRSSML
jgi:hypothetical protein